MLPSQAHSTRHESILLPMEAHATRFPQAIAVEFEGSQLTYADLARQSDRVAVRLRELGVVSGSLVAVYLQRSVEFVVVVTGILKAGAAYLPIDPFVPAKRLEYMLDDSEAMLAVTEHEFLSRLGGRRGVIAGLFWPRMSNAG